MKEQRVDRSTSNAYTEADLDEQIKPQSKIPYGLAQSL